MHKFIQVGPNFFEINVLPISFQVCGKTFAKSYNLVVHMRMHEDVRPFGCSFCDQTFRQKAHLQRHETTHGVGVKVNRGSTSAQRYVHSIFREFLRIFGNFWEYRTRACQLIVILT